MKVQVRELRSLTPIYPDLPRSTLIYLDPDLPRSPRSPPGAKRPDGTIYARNLLSEYFLIDGDKIRGIYAAMHYMTPDIADAPGWQ